MEISSREGTTQGCPFSMPGYAIGILPLMSLIVGCDETHKVRQAAFADDLTGVGKLNQLLSWWKMIVHFGPYIGYYAKPSKSWLIVKEEYYNEAMEMFSDTGLNVTMEGKKHLGAVIGSNEFKTEYVKGKVLDWVKQIEVLSKFAWVSPHLAYSAYVQGFKHKFNFIFRTIPNIERDLDALDNVIDRQFIPALLNGRKLNADERKLISLPVKFGGLGIGIPSEYSSSEYNNSRRITSTLVERIKMMF